MFAEHLSHNPRRWETADSHAMASVKLPAINGLISPSPPPIPYISRPSNTYRSNPEKKPDEKETLKRVCAEALARPYARFTTSEFEKNTRDDHVSTEKINPEDNLDIRIHMDQRVALPPISELFRGIPLGSERDHYVWQTSRHSSFSSTSDGGSLYQISPTTPSNSVFSSLGSSGHSTAGTSPAASFSSQTSLRDPFQVPTFLPTTTRYLPHYGEPEKHLFRCTSPEPSYIYVRREPYSTTQWESRRASSLVRDDDSEPFVEVKVLPRPVRRVELQASPRLKSQSPKKKGRKASAAWQFKSETGKEKRCNTKYTFEQGLFIIYHKVDLGLEWSEVNRRYDMWFLEAHPARSKGALSCEYYRTNSRIPYVRPDGLLDLGPFARDESEISKEAYEGARFRIKAVKCRDDGERIPLSERFPEEMVNPRNLWILPEHREDPEIIRLAAMRKAQREQFLRRYPQVINP